DTKLDERGEMFGGECHDSHSWMAEALLRPTLKYVSCHVFAACYPIISNRAHAHASDPCVRICHRHIRCMHHLCRRRTCALAEFSSQKSLYHFHCYKVCHLLRWHLETACPRISRRGVTSDHAAQSERLTAWEWQVISSPIRLRR